METSVRREQTPDPNFRELEVVYHKQRRSEKIFTIFL